MPDYLVFPLYLFYGLSFFAIGVAIVVKDRTLSRLELARSLWLFAGFACFHGLFEWVALHIPFLHGVFPPEAIVPIALLQAAFQGASFLFLLAFGISLLGSLYPRKIGLLHLFATLLALVWLLSIVACPDLREGNFSLAADLRSRHLLAFPASLLAGVGLIFHSRLLRPINPECARHFFGAGLFLLLFGFLSGLMPSQTTIPILQTPIEAIRLPINIMILYFILKGLQLFDIERISILQERLLRFSQSEKLNAMGKLAAGIAHEINNPLTNASLGLELLRTELDRSVPGPHGERLQAIERNIDRASLIARELLHFSRHRDADFVPVDLNALIQSSLLLLGARREEYRIETVLEEELPPVLGISWKLEEIFVNLLINAMDASSPGAPISITTRYGEEGIMAVVEDRGSGIEPQDLPHIFDPFFTTKELGRGTGLGLSICFGIMQLHGGRIEVDSAAGKGTSVVLFFPEGG